MKHHVCRALAAPVEPVLKILNLDGVSDVRMPDLHGHGGQSASDLADPVFPTQRGEGLGDGFVEGFSRRSRAPLSFRSWTTTVL